MKKRILPLLLVVLLLCSIACSKSVDPSGARALSFQDATSVTALKSTAAKPNTRAVRQSQSACNATASTRDRTSWVGKRQDPLTPEHPN